jgi:hypothetical protein
MQVLELGTHRSVVITDGRRQVIHHTPPLTISQFCTAYKQMKAGQLEADNVDGLNNATPTPDPLDLDNNVLNDPLLHDTSPGGTGRTSTGTRQAPLAGTGQSLGQFTDYHGKRRTLPRLMGHTILGILLEAGSLDLTVTPDDALLRTIATAASRYRRQQGFGGPDAGPEATELYIRIFRAMGMTSVRLETQDADDLSGLYKDYLDRHAGN